MQAQNISLTLPIDQAMNRVKTMLFQPLDAGKWFVIGFCAWLAYLGENGFGGGGNYNFGDGHGGRNLRQAFEQAKDFVLNNLAWLLPLVAVGLVVVLVLGLVMAWLRCRGQFMFLHCVALNRAEVSQPWQRYAREANSLFLFRMVVGLIGFFCVLPFIAGIVVIILAMVAHGRASVVGVLGALCVTLFTIVVAILFGVIGKLTKDFVVPIQFTRGGTAVEGWRVLYVLLSENVGHIILYLLFQIVLSLAIFACVVAIVLGTCCIAGCLLAIPYLGTVLLLPVLTFQRAYSLYYLAQYGAGFDVLQTPVAADRRL
jgi:hypothetical protein